MSQSSQSSGRNDAGTQPGTDAGVPVARARSAVLPQTPPTLATVADEAGVSRQTVSNALNNPELLRPETLDACPVGHRPARLLAQPGRPPAAHPLLAPVRAALRGGRGGHQQRADGPLPAHAWSRPPRRTGHHVLLFSGDPEDPLDGYDDLLRSTAVDAFVVTDTYAGTPQAGFLQDRGAPFVAFGRPWDDTLADHAWIDVDGAHGARIATEHLLAQGHERVAWLGWEKTSRIGQDRRSGWEDAMRAAGQDVTELAVRTSDNVDAARMAAHELLNDTSVSGFVCASDTLAIGVLHALAERSLRPGADVGVVGFDDSLAAQVTWPGLTSVRQPLEQVAEELVSILHLVLAHKPLAERGRMLEPSLVVRRSSQR